MASVWRNHGVMQLIPHIRQLQQDLEIAAATGSQEQIAFAERLLPALDTAARLVLLDALTAAADELTATMAPSSVTVQLRGRNEVSFRLTKVEAPADASGATMASPTEADPDEATARVNFRPPESLKTRMDQAAAAQGLSLNAWLVRVVSGALEQPRSTRHTRTGRVTGWMS